MRAGGTVAACWSNPHLNAYALLNNTNPGSRAIKKKKRERRGSRRRKRRRRRRERRRGRGRMSDHDPIRTSPQDPSNRLVSKKRKRKYEAGGTVAACWSNPLSRMNFCRDFRVEGSEFRVFSLGQEQCREREAVPSCFSTITKSINEGFYDNAFHSVLSQGMPVLKKLCWM